MVDQLRFLSMDHSNKPFVIRTTAASPARRQWRERAYVATTKLPPQPFDATDDGGLAPQVTTGVVEAMAGAAGDRIPQVHVPTFLTARRALEPRTANALHRLVPNNRDGSSLKPNTGRTGGELAIDAQQVQDKTTADALGDLSDGTLDFMFIDGVLALSQQKAGKVRLLATTGARVEGAPDIPTMREAGVDNYSFAVWWMIMAPARTPNNVVATLNNIFTKINAADETKTFLANVASRPLIGTPAEMVEKLRGDIAMWAEIAKSGNIQPQ
jgi:hypothetical protein